MREDVGVLSTHQPRFIAEDRACLISPNPYLASISRHLGQPSTAGASTSNILCTLGSEQTSRNTPMPRSERRQRIPKRGHFRHELGMHLLHDRIDDSFEYAVFAVVVMIQCASGDVRLGDQLFRADA